MLKWVSTFDGVGAQPCSNEIHKTPCFLAIAEFLVDIDAQGVLVK